MQFTFNIPDAHIPRLKAWMLSKFDPTDETYPPTDAQILAEFRYLIRKWIQEQVRQYELLEEHKASEQNYAGIDVQD